ncbi:hypothetical protein GUJ93_ZPchr0010g11134 [Zizania palustris]|uniref:Uncharacterized protein n=1 Tax=Zizania palustris TaxID=103762 RepID=A0A8J6BFC5_ZIZPA|nr:hypothetical protein GUJ93_ZPchr0010g11134 [Zizania palustris]
MGMMRILRLEPQFKGQQPTHSQHSEAGGVTGSSAEYTELKMPDINRHFEPRKTRTRRRMYLIWQRVISGGNGRTAAQRGQACNVCGRRSAVAVFGYQ